MAIDASAPELAPVFSDLKVPNHTRRFFMTGNRPMERRSSDFRAREDQDVWRAPPIEHSTDYR